VFQNVIIGYKFCDVCNVHRFSPFFHCYKKKCMTHKRKITPATSPLFCNHPTTQSTLCIYCLQNAFLTLSYRRCLYYMASAGFAPRLPPHVPRWRTSDPQTSCAPPYLQTPATLLAYNTLLTHVSCPRRIIRG